MRPREGEKVAPVFSLLCKAGHFLPLVVDPCNEADAASRRKGDEKAVVVAAGSRGRALATYRQPSCRF